MPLRKVTTEKKQQPSDTMPNQQPLLNKFQKNSHLLNQFSEQQAPALPISIEPFREEEKVIESFKKTKREYLFNENRLRPECKEYRDLIDRPDNNKVEFLKCKLCNIDIKINSICGKDGHDNRKDHIDSLNKEKTNIDNTDNTDNTDKIQNESL